MNEIFNSDFSLSYLNYNTLGFDNGNVAPVTRPRILAQRPVSCTAANEDRPTLTKPKAKRAACAKTGAAPAAPTAAPANWPPPILGPYAKHRLCLST